MITEIDITDQLRQALTAPDADKGPGYKLTTIQALGGFFHVEAILVDQDEDGDWFAAENGEPENENRLHALIEMGDAMPQPIEIDELWWVVWITPHAA